eukprot:4406133-Amphidinium_carterae.1
MVHKFLRQLAITLPWSFFVSLLYTIILCLHYSYFGSTISPLATVRQFVADPVGTMAGVNGDFALINGHISQETMSALQQPRLKASSRAVPSTMPTMVPTMPKPAATSNPTSPPEERPTSHNGATGTGAASTTPMDTGADVAADIDSEDTTMRPQSMSSGSTSSQATVWSETMLDIEQLMWEKLVTPQCSPLVRQQLDDADYYPLDNQSATEKLKAFATIGNTQPIHRDSFIPTQWDNNQEKHLWFSWFTEAQLRQFQHDGRNARQCTPLSAMTYCCLTVPSASKYLLSTVVRLF